MKKLGKYLDERSLPRLGVLLCFSAVFMLFAYRPWSKLGHLVYRTTALVYAHQAGRLPLKREEEKTFLV